MNLSRQRWSKLTPFSNSRAAEFDIVPFKFIFVLFVLNELVRCVWLRLELSYYILTYWPASCRELWSVRSWTPLSRPNSSERILGTTSPIIPTSAIPLQKLSVSSRGHTHSIAFITSVDANIIYVWQSWVMFDGKHWLHDFLNVLFAVFTWDVICVPFLRGFYGGWAPLHSTNHVFFLLFYCGHLTSITHRNMPCRTQTIWIVSGKWKQWKSILLKIVWKICIDHLAIWPKTFPQYFFPYHTTSLMSSDTTLVAFISALW